MLEDLAFPLAILSVICVAALGFYDYWKNRPLDYSNFKPKYNQAGMAKLQAEIYGNVKEDENPKEESVKKGLWDRILEAIGI